MHYVFLAKINLRSFNHKTFKNSTNASWYGFFHSMANNMTKPTLLTHASSFFPIFFHISIISTYYRITLFGWSKKKFIFIWDLNSFFFAKVLLSIFHRRFFLFLGKNIGKFPKRNWDDDGSKSCYSTIYGCIPFCVIFVISPTFVLLQWVFELDQHLFLHFCH